MRRILAVLALGALAPMVQGAGAEFVPSRFFPDLGLLLVAALGLCWRSTAGGLVLAALLGYATDLLSGALLGQHVLLRVLAFGAARLASRQLDLRGARSRAVFALFLSAANALMLGALAAFFASGAGAGLVAVGALWPHALIDAAFAPPLFRATEWLIGRLGDEEDGRRLIRLEPRSRSA